MTKDPETPASYFNSCSFSINIAKAMNRTQTDLYFKALLGEASDKATSDLIKPTLSLVAKSPHLEVIFKDCIGTRFDEAPPSKAVKSKDIETKTTLQSDFCSNLKPRDQQRLTMMTWKPH